MPMRRRTRALLLALIAIVVVLGTIYWRKVVLVLWRQSKPLTTVVRMRDLLRVLQAEAPPEVSRPTLQRLLEQSNRSECLLDGWGRPFTVEIVRDSGRSGSTFRVTSLGSDGKEGSCCQRWVDSFEDDAVLEADRWLQQWTFGRPIQAEEQDATP